MTKNRLAEVIKAKGLTQKSFAEMAGTSSQYINAVASGRLTASIKQLSRFAAILGVNVSDLFLEPQGNNVAFCPHCGKPIRIAAVEKEKEEE